jgi:hypothetical protein
MYTSIIKKAALVREVALIPDDKLDAVKAFVDSVLSEANATDKNHESLDGIWKDDELENIEDLQNEIMQVQSELDKVGRQLS